MKKSVCKIKITEMEISHTKTDVLKKSDVLPVPQAAVTKDKIAPAGEREIAQANNPHSPLRGKNYDNRAHHGHDGSYSAHKRAGKIGGR
jgi:hypothetical protein